jgi:hypothetical protein
MLHARIFHVSVIRRQTRSVGHYLLIPPTVCINMSLCATTRDSHELINKIGTPVLHYQIRNSPQSARLNATGSLEVKKKEGKAPFQFFY